MKDKWKTGTPGTFDGSPANYVLREEIKARFRGGWPLKWFLIKWRIQQTGKAFAILKRHSCNAKQRRNVAAFFYVDTYVGIYVETYEQVEDQASVIGSNYFILACNTRRQTKKSRDVLIVHRATFLCSRQSSVPKKDYFRREPQSARDSPYSFRSIQHIL